jgi:hypothetical protein
LRDRILNKSEKLSFFEFSRKVIDENTNITTTQTYLDRFDDDVLNDANEMITGDFPKEQEVDPRKVTLI